ncbi:MAG: primosomal protein N' [Chloroflexi bacterium]|nr:primosomal protein N' [Chloroflexota bacterium]
MPTYLEIAVNVPRVSGVFHYHLPSEMEGQVEVGHLVEVPFGKQTVQGIVLRFVDQPEVAETRPVNAILDAQAVVSTLQLSLAEHIAETTLAPLAACIGLMLPVGLSQQADTLYSLTETVQGETVAAENFSKMQTRIVALLHKRGPLRGRQIDRSLPRKINWRGIMRALVKKGLISSKPVLPPPSIRPKYIRTAQLAAPPEVAQTQIDDLGKTSTTKHRRKKMIQFLLREPGPVDVAWVYAESGGNLLDLRILAERDLVILREQEAFRDPLAGLAYDPSIAPPLTAEQETVWGVLQTGLLADKAGEKTEPYLLHGVTGSGKTEIYMRAVAEIIAQGRQAIVLVPEIALTPQTVRRFVSRFPGRVGLVHSRLSPGERYDTWRRARQGRFSIIIGPRSALFTPLPDVGLVVVDESHDDSYYQSNMMPYYHAREVAVAYAKLAGAVCILGSATPDITSYHRAQSGVWKLLELPSRILAHVDTIRAQTQKLGLLSLSKPAGGKAEKMDLPPVQVVDMRAELKGGNRSIFSRNLQEKLGNVLQNRQQAILFLNRKGTATYVFCRDCGHALRCPRCDTPLTNHVQISKQIHSHEAGEAKLVCHHCGYRRHMPKTCPNCKSKRIRQYGMGTERVEAEVLEHFPRARILRWDSETTRQKGAHEIILSHFSNQRADILVGTQMVAKGLDLPLVTLVGVVLADVGLHLPDYRAGERVFQVLSQVAGRAGRSPLGGQVVLQTFHPKHYVIAAAAQHDYLGFYQSEKKYRRELGYPPYNRLVRLEYRHLDNQRAQAEAERMGAQIQNWLHSEDRRATELIGPAPCFYTRLDREYRWQIILRGPDPASLLLGRKLGDWRIEVNPQALL